MKRYLIPLTAILISLLSCGETKEEPTYIPSQTVSIPDDAITFDFDSHLYFNVKINDSIDARLAFDTGNTGLLLDKKFYADTFGNSRTLSIAMVSGAGSKTEHASIDMKAWNYSIGKYNRNENMAVVLDLRSILGDEVDGLLGMNMVKDSIVEISYDDSYMRFLPSSFTPDDSYTHIQGSFLDDNHSRLIIPVNVTIDDNTVINGRFLVDTGAGTGIIIGAKTSIEHMLCKKLPNAKYSHLTNSGVGGEGHEYCSPIKEIEIGGHKITDELIYFSTDDKSAISDHRYDGIIGNDILKHYDIIINFSTADIYIRPSSYFSQPTPKYNTGLTLTRRNKSYGAWVVNGIVDGCNAQIAGVQRGDMIISINGRTVDEIDNKELEKISHTSDTWTIKIIRDKEEFSISFEKDQL